MPPASFVWWHMTQDEWKDLRDFIVSVVIDSPHGGDNETMKWFREKLFKVDEVIALHTGASDGQDS
jgi:hypothetical protein